MKCMNEGAAMKKRKIREFYLILCLIFFLVMVYYSSRQSFWHDELYQLGLVRKGVSFQEVLKSYVELWDYTPPLYAMISAAWLRLVPFSNKWLLLPSEIFVVSGVYILAVTAEKKAGERVGILTAILGATSSTLILSGGHEFRSYALFFLASTLVLAAYLSCYERKLDGEKHFLLALAMIMLAYSHYYGSLILFVLFVADLWLWKRGRRTAKLLLPYAICAVCFAPWMIAVLCNHRTSMSEFWTEAPDPVTVIETIRYLISDNELLWIVLIICCVILCRSVFVFKKTKEWKQEQSLTCLLLWVTGAVFALMYTYAAFINPSGGAFQDRYFIGLLPYIFIAIALMCENLYLVFLKEKGITFLAFAVIIFLYLAGGNYQQVATQADKKREPYEQSIQILKKKGDIAKKTTAVLVSDCSYVTEGYRYFFERKGREVKVEMISQEDKNLPEQLVRYDKLYVLTMHNKLTAKNKRLLSQSFDCLYQDKETRISAYRRRP